MTYVEKRVGKKRRKVVSEDVDLDDVDLDFTVFVREQLVVVSGVLRKEEWEMNEVKRWGKEEGGKRRSCMDVSGKLAYQQA